MTTKNPLNARRLIVLSGLALLAVAATAAALPIPLGFGQQVDTPAGSVAAQSDDKGANTCIDAGMPPLPALPAVPALPLPLPIALPAIPAAPQPQANAQVCAAAGTDGVSASADADAMGARAGTGAEVDTGQQTEAVKETAGGAKGFIESLASRVMSWF